MVRRQAAGLSGGSTGFDAAPRGLEPWRQHERLAQVLAILVDRETGAVRRQLEEHAARLLEVDRLEPESIDDGRRLRPAGLDLRAHRELMQVVVHAPREMMNAADAPRAAAFVGRLADVHDPGAVGETVARPSVLFGDALEAEHRRQELGGRRQAPFPDLRAVQASHLTFGLDGAVLPRREFLPLRTRWFHEREPQPVRIDERQHAIAEARFGRTDAGLVLLEPLSPEVEAAGRHFERDFHRQPVSDAGRRHLSPREEREVGAGRSFRVRVEQVIGAGIVLVDALLDEPHPEHAAVEVEVLLRGTGDRRDVVQPVDAPHEPILDRLSELL